MTRSHGLTLIELMVALAVFAVLGLLSYRALAQIGEHRQRIGVELARWREIGRGMLRIETDLLQVVTPVAQPETDPPPALELHHLPDLGLELRLLVADGTRGKVARVAYRFDHGRLEWVRWPGRLAQGNPAIDPLIDQLAAVRWRFLFNGRKLDAWPPDNAQTTLLPQAVELELELADAGTVTRLIPMR
ncbi:MAG: prepilin-type N-terminal cleavage/methylation domain-containing protein [Zoogloeaceae bacterium]|nr:prepilin-type N-terminal cleavage/methylation domain-containing protein [Zoogloeaceae bacterium]